MLTGLFAATGLIGAGAFAVASSWYKVCRPSQLLVRTGLGIERMEISSSGFVWPFQQSIYISKSPVTYDFVLQAMTTEKIEFSLPMVFSLAPILPEEDIESTYRYAKYFSDSTEAEKLRTTILGVIEGEARGVATQMTVEQLFHDRDLFKELIIRQISPDLKSIGLKVINANIRELMDLDESNKYFTYRKQRAIESANYEAQVDVADARKKGRIGITERNRDTRIAISNLELSAKREENNRAEELEHSKATLQEILATARQRKEVANIEATMHVKNITSDLQHKVEIMRQQERLEQLRADQLGETKVRAEQEITQATGMSAAKRLLADAHLYERNAQSAAVLAGLTAYGKGLQDMAHATRGDMSLGRFYMALQSGVFEKLAKEQAKAVKNLQPRISVWDIQGDIKSTK